MLYSKLFLLSLDNSKKVLLNAISRGGSSIKDFSNIGGKIGKFQQVFHVYGRNGKNCLNKNCYGTIIKIVISNRATFYCNICQK